MIYLYPFHSYRIRDNSGGIFPGKPRIGRNGERSRMAQHAILRFEKHKGNPARPLEAHHERQKDSMPAIPTLTQAGANTTSISSSRKDAITTSFRAVSSRPDAGRGKTARFVDTLITASRSFSRGNPQRRYRRSSSGRRTSSLDG